MTRASFVAGTLYAVRGRNDWIYYGQVTPTKNMGFFRYRTRDLAAAETVLANDVMCNIGVWLATVGQALRSGTWIKMGKFALHPSLAAPRPYVIWSVGTSSVQVFTGQGDEFWRTTVDDPAIQNMEICAAWGAVDHIPARLEADFGAEPGEWYIGGPIWRERRVALERARRAPHMPWHQARARDALLSDEWSSDTP